MEKGKSNRISYVIYAVTTFNCLFMLVSIACLCWNVNIHREVSRLKDDFDTVIHTEHREEHERAVRSAVEPGSQEDIEFRKREDQTLSMLDPGPESDSSNGEDSSHQATCSECKRICTLIFYHQVMLNSYIYYYLRATFTITIIIVVVKL